jgi:hypothetical protein
MYGPPPAKAGSLYIQATPLKKQVYVLATSLQAEHVYACVYMWAIWLEASSVYGPPALAAAKPGLCRGHLPQKQV